MFELTILQGGREHKLRFEKPAPLGELLERAGLAVPHPCGGRGLCGKCAAELSGQVSPPNERERALQSRLCCQAQILGDAWLTLPEEGKMQVETDSFTRAGAEGPGRPMPGRLGAAVDLGTTTIAVKAYDLATGACLGSAAGVNPQTGEAGDVMGRISAALEGRLPALQRAGRGGHPGPAEACPGGPAAGQPGDYREHHHAVPAGGTHPQKPQCSVLSGRLPVRHGHRALGGRAYLPPCMNAFVGADITCAVLASGMCQSPEKALLCDLGTNGELALWSGGRLYVASTAAGPAFEGAGISCGSGLIDAVAAGLELGLIDETGAVEQELRLTGSLSLTQRDIRAVQLAKAAIAAGIETLLEAAGLSPGAVEAVYLAGGFAGASM